jgi:valyl-tRNA synthetase
MEKKYSFQKIEPDIYKSWQKKGLFNPDNLDTGKEARPYIIMMPPPNVTGSLHIGHALNATVTDIIIRQKRMQGYRALWLPGLDHAGIATQNVVEKRLAEKGKTRKDLGKEEFVKEVWKWKEESGGKILDQFKKLGASCDWSRTRFTLDEDYQQAVKKAFKIYKKKGYIYQGNRVVNWCPRCSSSLSDLELEYKDKKSKLYYIKYPLENKNGHIRIATTRPETMLGDTAIAVNSEDDRYKDLVGKKVRLPIADRIIEIIADHEVDPKFGTGAVKITPSSDLTDERIAKRHNLKTIKIIDKQGKMTDKVPERYQGLNRFKARKEVVEELKKKNLLEKEEIIENRISLCYRCGTVIEPLPSKQWFVNMNKLKEPAIKAVEEDRIKFYPEKYKKVYLNWMEDVRDWCISRQIWWGHEIPVKGEKDVLDTWFSSALWPFATLGWPEQTDDLKKFYPTQMLATAKDILYLWVARMIFSSLELTQKIPFQDIYIHATVKNKQGQRMSKSLGTGIDPLDLIEKYGADATRFSLAWNSGYNQEIRYSEEDVVAGQKFTNKVWNAVRFVLINTDKKYDLPTNLAELEPKTKKNREIKKELEKTIKETNKHLAKYRYDLAIKKIYHFFWHSFCDICLEANKEAIFSENRKDKKEAVEFLAGTIAISLKLLHPFMPHLTEKLWQELNKAFGEDNKQLIISSWPE